MSEDRREPSHREGQECWCLQCLYKRIDTKTAATRATELYHEVQAAREPADGDWLKRRDEPGKR
jgi:hypothetical protein